MVAPDLDFGLNPYQKSHEKKTVEIIASNVYKDPLVLVLPEFLISIPT
jgi:hypothetical protein